MKELDYPFDGSYLLKKRKSLKKKLMEQSDEWINVNVALLCGSTVVEIRELLELFLLNAGIKVNFYESRYNQYWEDIMFGSDELDEFKPDLIWIHTTSRNIMNFPALTDSKLEIDDKLKVEYDRLEQCWERIREKYNCTIIQNNFERPLNVIMGNQDICDYHGKSNFISRLNQKIYEYSWEHKELVIHDIDGLSARYGLDQWQEPRDWYLYKYVMNRNAIPYVSFNLSLIIKAILGKNKKVLVLDDDNTLWGGVIAEDGLKNIELGMDNSAGQAFGEWQKYLLELKETGVLLTLMSKNEAGAVKEVFQHPDIKVHKEDLVYIKTNWKDKSENIREVAEILNIGLDYFVFVDDTSMERELVKNKLPQVAIVEESKAERFIQYIRNSGFFEINGVTADGLKVNHIYITNPKGGAFDKPLDYNGYMKDLKMRATIKNFEELYCNRITQLINKTNQFNLTTEHFTSNEIMKITNSKNYVSIYGRLNDKFGDNGIVSVLIAEKKQDIAEILIFILSCTVFNRGMEYAIFNTFVEKCRKENLQYIYGRYIPTIKNHMVSDLYDKLGFTKTSGDSTNGSEWKIEIAKYRPFNSNISINGEE